MVFGGGLVLNYRGALGFHVEDHFLHVVSHIVPLSFITLFHSRLVHGVVYPLGYGTVSAVPYHDGLLAYHVKDAFFTYWGSLLTPSRHNVALVLVFLFALADDSLLYLMVLC